MTKESLFEIVRVLNDAGARYLVVEGIAVNAHGYVRMTKDVDLLIHLEQSNLLQALNALKQLGHKPSIPVSFEQFADPKNREAWIAEKAMKVLKLFSDAHRETIIDIFVDDPLGFWDAYKRVEWLVVTDNVRAPVCSYQDLITLKMQASRPKDLDDLAKLKKARGEA